MIRDRSISSLSFSVRFHHYVAASLRTASGLSIALVWRVVKVRDQEGRSRFVMLVTENERSLRLFRYSVSAYNVVNKTGRTQCLDHWLATLDSKDLALFASPQLIAREF